MGHGIHGVCHLHGGGATSPLAGGGLLNVPGILSTASHVANIQPLLDEVCEINQPQLCQGLVAYVLNRKDRKLDEALVKYAPARKCRGSQTRLQFESKIGARFIIPGLTRGRARQLVQ